ncbi:RsmD family RNA methyltransferase [bacterium]|nr:RsmD family RNA methyltransferase [bacterium]
MTSKQHTTRILGGTLKFRTIKQPGEGTRPVAQKIRQAIFDTLGHDLSGLRAADLYAGSGALGFEALSLGAERVTFVERSAQAVRLLEQSAHELGVDAQVHVAHRPVETELDRLEQQDIIFFDPPYDACDLTIAARAIEKLSDTGVLVLSCSSRQKLPEQLGAASMVKSRVYGATQIAYYKK